jgi:hypothetical protein
MATFYNIFTKLLVIKVPTLSNTLGKSSYKLLTGLFFFGKIYDMEQETKIVSEKKYGGMNKGGTPSGAVYGLGFIGAAIYFIQHADTFWIGVLGILKALVWPAFLIYKLLEFLKF